MFSAWLQYVHYTVTQCTILHGTQRTHSTDIQERITFPLSKQQTKHPPRSKAIAKPKMRDEAGVCT